MNVSAVSGRSITSLRSHASRLDFVQQPPSDAALSGYSKLQGIDPQRLELTTWLGKMQDKIVSIISK